MPEKRPFQDHTVMDKFVAPVADYQMVVGDRVVRPSASPATGAITITLPPVDDAAGYFYSIVARDADGTNTITIQDLDESECWKGDITLNGVCDAALLFSDGLKWHRVTVDTTFAGTTFGPTTLATTAAPTTG